MPKRRRKKTSEVDRLYQHRSTLMYRESIPIWNMLKLNQSYSIGSLKYLFKECNSQIRKNWENFYYESGQKRKTLLKKLPKEKRELIEDFTLPQRYKYHEIEEMLTPEELELNTKYGRTKDDLRKIASFFRNELQKEPKFKNLNGQTVFEYVVLRVIHETYLGFQREWNTIHFLEENYPQLKFLPASHEKDIVYAIDCEVFKDGQLICGLQIKSSQYNRSRNSHMNKVRKMNNYKNYCYKKEFNVPVYYVYSSRQGIVENRFVLEQLEKANKE